MNTMRLRIATPLTIAADEPDVVSLRAEDATGGFGLLPGHAAFMTSLAICVLRWRRADGSQCFCAVRHGLLRAPDGHEVEVATREAVLGDTLETLDTQVLARFRADIDAQRVARVNSERLHLNTVRQMLRYLRQGHEGLMP